MRLRCSSLPLFLKCGQSIGGLLNVNEWHQESNLGTAVHAALARHLSGVPVDVAAIALLYGVDEGEMGYLYSQGLRAWAEIEPKGGKVFPEISFALVDEGSSVHVTGTADVVVELEGGGLEVVDWKTGRRDADCREQVLGYCALALDSYRHAEWVTARVVWLRTLEAEIYTLRRSELDLWKTRLALQVQDLAYRPGPHCTHCPRRYECEARIQMSTAALAVLGSERGKLLRALPPDEQVNLYRRAKDVIDLAYRVIDQVKELAGEAPIVGHGVRLEMVDEQRRSLNAAAAWPTLQEHLSENALADAVSVSITKVQDAVAAGAPKGQGASRKRALMAALEAAGAVGSTTIRKLTERRV